MKKKKFRILPGVHHYLVFFLMVAFVITCCLMLFISVLSRTLDVKFTEAHLNTAAKWTFGNVVLISLLFTTVDVIRRKITIERPAREIRNVLQKLTEGDFSARIPDFRLGYTEYGFQDIAESINALGEELGGVETLRTDFMANVSHELKTPLAVMQNYGTMLQQPDLSEEQRMEYAKAITSASRRLANLITNILKLNKLEHQQIFPVTEEYDLGEQLCECLLQFEDAWERKDLSIETDLEEGVVIRSDRELLSLVWNNLISNAVKFTEPGGTVSVSLKATEETVTVTVSDTGCGMSPEVGARIFEKFYQGDTSHATQGNGLGLALVKRVVNILQGEIGVQSVVGKGTAFTVTVRRK